MKNKKFVLWLILPSVICLCQHSAAHAWPKILPHHFGRYPVPPRVYGYKLDEDNPGYYGGARYREYYSFGRGYALADFPGPVPDYARGNWFKYNYWPYGSTELPKAAEYYHNPDCAAVVMHVPPDAQVWLQEQPTKQTGSTRTFVTPPLPKNQQFTYNIRVKWHNGTGIQEQTRKLFVQAGRHVNVHVPHVEQPEVTPVIPVLQPVPPHGQ